MKKCDYQSATGEESGVVIVSLNLNRLFCKKIISLNNCIN